MGDELDDSQFASELEKRQIALSELKEKYAELQVEMEYTIKRKDMAHEEEIAKLNTKFKEESDLLHKRIDDLEKAKDKAMDDYNSYLLEVKKTHDADVENVTAHYNTKLIGEFEKYNALQNLLEETIKEYEGRISVMESEKGTAIEDLCSYYESKIKEKNAALKTALEHGDTHKNECDEMRKMMEEDADQEIQELTAAYERKLKHERDRNTKLKGEAAVMAKKTQNMQKEMEEKMNEIQRLHQDLAKLSNNIVNTEREVVKLQKQLVDAEAANSQKDKTITDLQKSNTDLEKFKFILEHRIQEMRKNIDPKAREVIYLRQQNADMESELDDTISVRNGLQLEVSELQNKLKMMEKEYNMEKRLRSKFQVLLERIRSHMARCMSVLHDHKNLKATIRAMYNKYGEGTESSKTGSAEQDVICELSRQKKQIELQLESVKGKLAKDAQTMRTEHLKLMHENMLLVGEINQLRGELKKSRDRIQAYENALGIHSSMDPSETAEMRYKLQLAVEDRDAIDIRNQSLIESKKAVIKAQQEEIDALSTKIMKVNEFMHDAKENVPITSSGAGMRDPVGTTGLGTAALDHIRSVLGSGTTGSGYESSSTALKKTTSFT